MISELLLIASLGIINPMDMTGHKMYPSGVKECDKYPRFAPPASKLAKLTLPQDIWADNGEIIKSGHYLVGLSVSKNELLLFEGHKEIFAIEVEHIEILDRTRKIATAEFYTDNNSESFLVLIEGKLRVVCKVKLCR